MIGLFCFVLFLRLLTISKMRLAIRYFTHSVTFTNWAATTKAGELYTHKNYSIHKENKKPYDVVKKKTKLQNTFTSGQRFKSRMLPTVKGLFVVTSIAHGKSMTPLTLYVTRPTQCWKDAGNVGGS